MQHESKSGFFISRSHIGWDLRFSEQNRDNPNEIGMVGQSVFVKVVWVMATRFGKFMMCCNDCQCVSLCPCMVY